QRLDVVVGGGVLRAVQGRRRRDRELQRAGNHERRDVAPVVGQGRRLARGGVEASGVVRLAGLDAGGGAVAGPGGKKGAGDGAADANALGRAGAERAQVRGQGGVEGRGLAGVQGDERVVRGDGDGGVHGGVEAGRHAGQVGRERAVDRVDGVVDGRVDDGERAGGGRRPPLLGRSGAQGRRVIHDVGLQQQVVPAQHHVGGQQHPVFERLETRAERARGTDGCRATHAGSPEG